MRTQPVVTALMTYGAWLAWKCPCQKTLSCHLTPFFLALGTAAGLVAWENDVTDMLLLSE